MTTHAVHCVYCGTYLSGLFICEQCSAEQPLIHEISLFCDSCKKFIAKIDPQDTEDYSIRDRDFEKLILCDDCLSNLDAEQDDKP